MINSESKERGTLETRGNSFLHFMARNIPGYASDSKRAKTTCYIVNLKKADTPWTSDTPFFNTSWP